ncbi:ATP-binding protein [Actinoallomurus sp. NPDC052308]|uniref:sensor histidine kinase n=1 Tax=Actinoallomurus sp. NPDC052308 TaxID=3155530 RepID=UPI0034402D10
MAPGSLRGRLLLAFTLGTSVALILCLILLYVLLVEQLNAALDEDLAERSHDVATAATRGDIGAAGRDPLAQLYADDGTLIIGSPALARVRLLSVSEVRGLTGRRVVHRSLPPRGTPVRMLTRRIREGRVLAVAVPTRPINVARSRLGWVLFLAAPTLVGVLALAAWGVIRAALGPVRRLTREAAAISSLDTGWRLPTVPGHDEIAELARTLEALLARLRVAFERERAFVDDASHELRGPIAVLRGQLELARATVGEHRQVDRLLGAALIETDRLTRLTDDLLLLARERAGTLLLRREPLDLLDLAVAEARRLEPVLGVRIGVTGDPAVVDADADRLRRLIANLAGNSAAAGARAVLLTIRRHPHQVTIEVADDGPGFPPDFVDSAFERFTRADTARTRGSAGAGLGLSIVRSIAAAHGGSVDARNGPPLGGAVIAVHLPV